MHHGSEVPFTWDPGIRRSVGLESTSSSSADGQRLGCGQKLEALACLTQLAFIATVVLIYFFFKNSFKINKNCSLAIGVPGWVETKQKSSMTYLLISFFGNLTARCLNFIPG